MPRERPRGIVRSRRVHVPLQNIVPIRNGFIVNTEVPGWNRRRPGGERVLNDSVPFVFGTMAAE